LLNAYRVYLTNGKIIEADYIKIIPEHLLFNQETWSVSRFLKPSDETHLVAYPIVNLSKYCSVSKGANITLDDTGDLPVIGPASVRSFYIDPTRLDKTSNKKIALSNLKPRYACKNDILVHAIGPHRGEAALVGSEFDNFLISRHMIIVRLESRQILPGYLEIALNSTFVKKQVYNFSSGSIIASLTPGNIRDIVVPLPCVEDQAKIIENFTSIQKKLRRIQDSLIETEAELETLLDTYYTKGARHV